jgi:predicted negative regulator of RcsB-dependent stress response
MKNFIEVEKTDEEQAEQIKKWIKENALQIIIGVSLGLGGLWGFDYYKGQQHQQDLQARGYYLSVVANPSNTDALKALKENHAQSTYDCVFYTHCLLFTLTLKRFNCYLVVV